MKPATLYSHCPCCKGHGRIPERPEGRSTVFCQDCRGMGFVLTEDGKAVIGLIKAARVVEILPDINF